MAEDKQESAAREVDDVVARARVAQAAIADYTQDQVDALCTAIAWAVARPERADGLAKLAVDEGGFGNYEDKVVKINKRVLGVLADMRDVPTVGVVEKDPVTPEEFSKAREAFRAEVLNERRSRFFDAYMTKARARVKPEINSDVLQRIVAMYQL